MSTHTESRTAHEPTTIRAPRTNDGGTPYIYIEDTTGPEWTFTEEITPAADITYRSDPARPDPDWPDSMPMVDIEGCAPRAMLAALTRDVFELRQQVVDLQDSLRLIGWAAQSHKNVA